MYGFLSRISWTGLPRLMAHGMAAGVAKLAGGSEFDSAVLTALMCKSSFWGNSEAAAGERRQLPAR